MNKIETIELSNGDTECPKEVQERAINALENGAVLFLPRFRFQMEESERSLFSPTVVGKSKNVSYNPKGETIGGTSLSGEEAERLRLMMKRFAQTARGVLRMLLPAYDAGVVQARASFRPVEIQGRASSWRKDDTRLHVDSFPSSPTQGKRILRMFMNVNPEGKPRVWRVGEPFEQMAKRFMPATKRAFPGSTTMLQLLRVTKTRRSEYDHLMLQFHDLMKADTQYQKDVEQMEFPFPAGSTWIAYADQVSHAVMRGQYQMEQTFLVPVDSLRHEEACPLRVLERMAGRKLAGRGKVRSRIS